MHFLTINHAPTTGKSIRKGFTLVELLVAMVIFGILAGGIMQVIIVGTRSASDQATRIDVQQNMRAANVILPAEIRALDAAEGDIKAMGANTLTIRAMRQLAIICTAPVLGGALAGLTIVVRSPLYSSQRAFQANDSIFVWYEGDVSTRNDDGWVPGKVTAVLPQNCTDGTAGVKLTSTLTIAAPKTNTAGYIPLGSPIWGFETVTYATALGADGRYYLNLTNSSGTAPVLGPLPDAQGVTFTYYDANGAVTAVPANVRQIGLTVREQSLAQIRKGSTTGYAVDSLSTRITLRNNPRF